MCNILQSSSKRKSLSGKAKARKQNSFQYFSNTAFNQIFLRALTSSNTAFSLLLWKSVSKLFPDFIWSTSTAKVHHKHKVVVITSVCLLHNGCGELSSVFVPRAALCLEINKIDTFKKDLLMFGLHIKLDPLINTVMM